MPTKTGNGGHGQEQYDPKTGKYVKGESSRETFETRGNPTTKILHSLGLRDEDIRDEEIGSRQTRKEILDKDLIEEKHLKQLEEQRAKDLSIFNMNNEEIDLTVKREDRRKQLPQRFNSEIRERQIQEDIGCSLEEAKKIAVAIWDYTGGRSAEIGIGEDFVAWEMLEKYIRKAPKYDGHIYRGMHFTGDKGAEFISNLQIGKTLKMRGISSWTSEESYVNMFSGADDEYDDSVILMCENKNGVGIQHCSQYGEQEAEVIHSSYAKWLIKKIEETPKKGPYGKKIIKVYLEEV